MIGKLNTYSDLDDNSKKDPVPAAPSKKDIELIKARIASNPKTLAEIINMR